MTTLRLNRVHSPVTVLGHGRRLGIWVQGCPLACRGCMSRDTWDPEAGFEVTVPRLAELWRQAVRAGAEGLTISGGEPLAQPSAAAALLAAADEVRTELATPGRELDLLLYTGYEEEEFDDAQQAAVRHADVLITGRYDVARPTGLIWRGSAQQRMLLRTPLARRRYTPYLDHVPARPPMQVTTDEHGVWFIGVPGRGSLPTLERALRDGGVAIGGTSWRP
jgi:anaerobic ribonucleoside-triphosphate reductase activating protein